MLAISPPRASALGAAIGLPLCQRIVALHGGSLREAPDDDGHQVLIDLPTGAPAGDPAASLDVQQAAHFARDLASLMAQRARGDHTPASTPSRANHASRVTP